MRFTPGPGVGGHCLPIDPSLPVLAGAGARSGQTLPVRRAGQRRQRAHARLRGAPAGGGAQPRAQGGQRAAASCCSAWRTRRTPATPGSRRRWSWPTGCWRSAPTCARPIRTCRRAVRLGASCSVDAHARGARRRRRGRGAHRPRRVRLRRSSAARRATCSTPAAASARAQRRAPLERPTAGRYRERPNRSWGYSTSP